MDGYNSDSDTSLLSTQSDIDDIQFYENFDELDAHGWSYDAFSSRGADYVGNLRSRIGRENNFVLEYDATDQILFDKCKKEIINSLTQVRIKLFEVDEGQNIDLLESFCGSCPSDLLLLFSKWMKAGSTHNPASFEDICEFIRYELKLRVFDMSASTMLSDFGISQETYNSYKRVRKCMQKSDKPCSSRPAAMYAARLPSFTFDPFVAYNYQTFRILFSLLDLRE